MPHRACQTAATTGKRAPERNEADVLGTRQLIRRTVIQRYCRGLPAHNNRNAASCSANSRETYYYQVSIRTPDTQNACHRKENRPMLPTSLSPPRNAQPRKPTGTSPEMHDWTHLRPSQRRQQVHRPHPQRQLHPPTGERHQQETCLPCEEGAIREVGCALARVRGGCRAARQHARRRPRNRTGASVDQQPEHPSSPPFAAADVHAWERPRVARHGALVVTNERPSRASRPVRHISTAGERHHGAMQGAVIGSAMPGSTTGCTRGRLQNEGHRSASSSIFACSSQTRGVQ